MSKRSDRRSTSSKDVQGNSEDRRRRRAWLVKTFRANVDVLLIGPERARFEPADEAAQETLTSLWSGLGYDVVAEPACRCFHCGQLLTEDQVSPDRIVPGCVKTAMFPNGGTYARHNIRPACLEHNVKLGSKLGHERRRSNGARVAAQSG